MAEKFKRFSNRETSKPELSEFVVVAENVYEKN